MTSKKTRLNDTRKRWLFFVVIGILYIALNKPETKTFTDFAWSFPVLLGCALILIGVLAGTPFTSYLVIDEAGFTCHWGFRKKSFKWGECHEFIVWNQKFFGVNVGEFSALILKNKDGLPSEFGHTVKDIDLIFPGKYGMSTSDLVNELNSLRTTSKDKCDNNIEAVPEYLENSS